MSNLSVVCMVYLVIITIFSIKHFCQSCNLRSWLRGNMATKLPLDEIQPGDLSDNKVELEDIEKAIVSKDMALKKLSATSKKVNVVLFLCFHICRALNCL